VKDHDTQPRVNAGDSATPFAYIVKEGDTVDSIARQFGVDVAVLKALNNMTEALVRVSEQITIPNPG
jgi:LysM repeat protein